MFKKALMLVSFSLFSLQAHAGFFGGGESFKCGREDAVTALQSHIKSDAMGQLQSNYITNAHRFYNKELQGFQDKLNSITVQVSNVSTSERENGPLDCKAKIAVQLPEETLTLLKETSSYLSSLISGGGMLNNGSIVWDNYTYSIELADNKKDISINSIEYIPDVLYQATLLAVNKNDIIRDYYNQKLYVVKNEYTEKDDALNGLWRSLPGAIKNSMKKSQTAWINEKALKCGKLPDANSDVTPFPTRMKIYECQIKMTEERIDFLGGNEEG
ncbi:lysozyme inhibitor LprI family protein [Chimaeribacter arupi]|uniref:lysozyme inhibitor LprI family protein n=1 Tax=Chimaeribacter arupi TaxID=2060066 RepID=UPI000C7E7855|nr:lysozyme inhibitor LprI family protein [Chimaeribacter arupi]PLR36601.1 hypothetical protein CYR23_06600 [Chimaeribacter arupi]